MKLKTFGYLFESTHVLPLEQNRVAKAGNSITLFIKLLECQKVLKKEYSVEKKLVLLHNILNIEPKIISDKIKLDGNYAE